MATPGPVRFCPSCGSGQKLSIDCSERTDLSINAKFIVLDLYCYKCGWSGYIEPDDEEWEGDRWLDTRVIQL